MSLLRVTLDPGMLTGSAGGGDVADFPVATDAKADDVGAAQAELGYMPDDDFLDRMQRDEPTSTNDPASNVTADPAAGSQDQSQAGQSQQDTSQDTSAQNDTSSPAQQVTPEQFNKAMNALKRANTPQSVIDQMSKDDPQGLLDWGTALAETQAESDAFGTRLSEIEARMSGQQPPQNGTQDSTQDGQVADPSSGVEPSANVRARIGDLTKGLAEHWGEDGAKPMQDALTGVVEMIDGAFSQSMQQRDHALQYAVAAIERIETHMTKQSLGERYPDINTAEGWKQVEAAMSKLDRAQFKDLPAAIEAAASMSFGNANLKAFQENLARQHEARSNGQPQSVTKATAPKSTRRDAMSAEDTDDAVLDGLLSGDRQAAYRQAGHPMV